MLFADTHGANVSLRMCEAIFITYYSECQVFLMFTVIIYHLAVKSKCRQNKKRTVHLSAYIICFRNSRRSIKGRPLLQGVPNRARHPLSALLTSPCTAGSHPLEKQFTGLFFDSPLAERLCFFGLCPNPPEALPLDFAKGTQSLWNPVRELGKIHHRP